MLVFYRDELNRMQFDQFIWQPYSARILQDIPILDHESKLWCIMIPLINSKVVKCHRKIE